MSTPSQRKANNALGIFAISMVFLAESWVAHQHMPSPASPVVWGVLGLVAFGSLVYHFRHKGKPGSAKD